MRIQSNLQLSDSFIQDHKHMEKTNRFQHITPSNIAQTMSEFGFELVSLRTGVAKKVDRRTHQTTIARYRHIEALSSDLGGLMYDIVAIIPHLYGSIKLMSGIFRLVCANGLVVGSNIESERVPHIGDASSRVSHSIDRLVARRASVLEVAERMAGAVLSAERRLLLAREIGNLRVPLTSGYFIPDSSAELLLKPRRIADSGIDLWSIYNVIQENALNSNVVYHASPKMVGTTLTSRFKTNRILRQDSQVAIDFNKDSMAAALQYLPDAV